MGLKLNRKAFENLIAENVEWLLSMPRTLERDHIEMILKGAAECYYNPNHYAEAEKERKKHPA